MSNELQINELPSRKASEIATANLVKDPYHQSIQGAARKLVEQSKGDLIYRTQWSSGKTCWYDKGNMTTIIMEAE